MEKIKYTIYKLIDLTFNDLKLRLKSHLSEPGKSHKIYWIKSLKNKGLKPIIESVEENISTYEECCLREIYYIDYYRQLGFDLTNMATGGNKNKKMSDETRKKMSDSQKKRYETYTLVLSEETKETLRNKANERFQKDEERNRLRISNKRYEDSKTPEQKLKDILIQKNKFVIQYDKDMNYLFEYPSIKEGMRRTGVDAANISKCCQGKVKSAGGFIWRFK